MGLAVMRALQLVYIKALVSSLRLSSLPHTSLPLSSVLSHSKVNKTTSRWSSPARLSSSSRPQPTVSTDEVVGVDSFNATLGALDKNGNTEGGASFCDNADCTSCGIAVSLTNPGCLRQTGRKAIKFRGDPIWNTFTLITSPDDQCGCQNSCHPCLDTASGCFSLEGLQGGSYRFITGNGICPTNNC